MNDFEEFICKLALELHLPIVEVLNLPAWEIHRWQEYFSKNLFTADRVDFLLAQISFLLYNANSSKKAEFESFFPKPQIKKDSKEALIANLEAMRTIFGQKG